MQTFIKLRLFNIAVREDKLKQLLRIYNNQEYLINLNTSIILIEECKILYVL